MMITMKQLAASVGFSVLISSCSSTLPALFDQWRGRAVKIGFAMGAAPVCTGVFIYYLGLAVGNNTNNAETQDKLAKIVKYIKPIAFIAGTLTFGAVYVYKIDRVAIPLLSAIPYPIFGTCTYIGIEKFLL